jgi:hypothetical protein
MSLRIEEVTEEKDYNPLEINPEAPFTQSFFYGEIHKLNKRGVWRFNIFDEEEIVATIQIIGFKLFGWKKYFYAPYGPVIKKLMILLI